MKWSRKGDAFVCESWTPDRIADRDDRLAWMMRHRLPWSLHNGQLIPKGGREVSYLLDEAMKQGRGEWKSRTRALEAMGVPMAAEGTYGALGAYPLEATIAGSALSATEAGLISAANQALYMPIPARGILAPQAWRFVIASRYTVTTAPGSLITSFRLGNANTSPLLGTSASVALTASLTNAFVLYKGDITVQSVGPPGTNSKAIGIFDVKVNTAVGGAFNSALWGTASGTAVSFDSTVVPNASANGGQLWVGVSDTGATNHATISTDQIHWMDWN
jgi:hypothetical protein